MLRKKKKANVSAAGLFLSVDDDLEPPFSCLHLPNAGIPGLHCHAYFLHMPFLKSDIVFSTLTFH